MTKIYAVAMQKGGVGKTTTVVNLGAFLACNGYRVLVVDMDPQGNATSYLGFNKREIDPSVYALLEHLKEDAVPPIAITASRTSSRRTPSSAPPRAAACASQGTTSPAWAREYRVMANIVMAL